MRTRSILALGLGVPLLLVVAFAAFVTLHDGRKDIRLADFIAEDDWHRQMMPGAHVATGDVCGADLPCVEAVEAETLTLLKFRTKEEAAAVASRLGKDAHLSAWIVIHYESGLLTAAERTDVELYVDCTNTWVGAGGQDC